MLLRRWLASDFVRNWRYRLSESFERPGNWRCWWLNGRHRWEHGMDHPERDDGFGWWRCQRTGCTAKVMTYPGDRPRLPEPIRRRERWFGLTHLEIGSARARGNHRG